MMKTKNETVKWFRDAAPYIHQHKGKVFVIFFSGKCINGPHFTDLISDLAILNSLGIRLVLVYGARPQIEKRLAIEGIKSTYHKGLRVTTAKELDATIEAAARLRVLIEARLTLSLANTPMSGSQIRVSSGNYIVAKPLGIIDGVDYKYTGEVRRVDACALNKQLEFEQCLLLSPLGYSTTGEVFNLSAEDVATSTACAIRADKLIFLNDDKLRSALPSVLPIEDIDSLIARRKLPADTQQYLLNTKIAILNGVGRCHLINSNINGNILMELFTRDGVGTLVSKDRYEDIRNAEAKDLSGIISLIQPLEEKGILVKRSREQLELELGHFKVIERDGTIIATVALFPFPEEQTAEIACLAVHPDYSDAKRGKTLLDAAEKTAAAIGLKQVFVLSTRTMHWFQEQGYVTASSKDLPKQKASLYNLKRNSRVFIKALV